MMEIRNKGVLCLVTLPDSVVQAVEVDRNAEGREVLVKVCENLQILEVDYFGLTYHGAKGEELWLNLRNPIAAELPGSQPYHLRFCVKFFVEPHFIQQETTRKQFYLDVKSHFLRGRLKFSADEDVVQLAALILHIKRVDCKISSPCTDSNDSAYCEQFLPPGHQSAATARSVVDRVADCRSITSAQARSRFLKLASTSDLFGIHQHRARDDLGHAIYVGVGRDGLTEYEEEDLKLRRSWAWTSIQTATHNCLDVVLKVAQDDGVIATHLLKFSTKSAANAFYRDMTEVHSFYNCDTIGSLVAEQYCRDLKGTIISFFDENTCLGKRYVFDIRHTLQETYDCVRRILYAVEAASRSGSGAPVAADDPHISVTNSAGFTIQDTCHSCSSNCQALKQLNEIQEGLVCRVCVSVDIDTALVPCGHVICCGACAKQLDCCPVCKCTIRLVQPIFLPYVGDYCSLSSRMAVTSAVTCT